jgi:hypothetical protein
MHVDRRENVKISAVCVCVFVTCILTATSRLIERRRFPVFSRTKNMHTIVTFVYEAFSYWCTWPSALHTKGALLQTDAEGGGKEQLLYY